jgi:hypothetical protein
MSKFQIKKLPPIKLTDLLRRRKTNLKTFLKSSGITTYVTLQHKCNSLGVSVPTEEEFGAAVDVVVSSPQEGVVVLDPPVLLKDTGQTVQVDDAIHHSIVVEDSSIVSLESSSSNPTTEPAEFDVEKSNTEQRMTFQQKNSKKKKEKDVATLDRS